MVGSAISSELTGCPVCYGILSNSGGLGAPVRELDRSFIQRRPLHGRAKPAGDMLAYSIQIKCRLIVTTYDRSQLEWEWPEWEQLILSLGFPECSDILLIYLLANIKAFCQISALNSSLQECCPAATRSSNQC